MDPNFDAILRGMIQVERSRRTIPTTDAFASVTYQATKKQALSNSSYPIVLDRAAAQEYELRAEKWLSIAHRAVSEADLSWTSDRAKEILHVLENELLKDWEGLIDLLRKAPGQRDIPRLTELDNAKDRARNQLCHEFELLVYAQDRSRVPIAEQLTAPRYAAVLLAWKKARHLVDSAIPDYTNAAKEAVSAVEQLGRIVTDKPAVTLGDVIKHLRASSRIQAPLLKGIEEIWAWASGTPGVRHGSAAPIQVDVTTARYIVAQADAAIALLLANDST